MEDAQMAHAAALAKTRQKQNIPLKWKRHKIKPENKTKNASTAKI